jgi:general secretion pathway protein C
VTALAGADLAVQGGRHVALSPTGMGADAASAEPPGRPSAEAILARNPFDSVTGPLLGAPEGGTDADESAPACDGVRVVAIVTSPEPAWSFAVLDVRGESHPIFRRAVAADGAPTELLGVAPDRVLVAHDGRRCVARLFAPARAPLPSGTQPAVRGIARGGPGEFIVDRATRDALIDGGASFMRSVAVQPEKSGDEVIGVRLLTLKPGTPLDALGLLAGDVLASVDRIPLISPEKMLEALARLRTAEHIHATVLRGGRPIELDYIVR